MPSECTAETNHFSPVTRYQPSSAGTATVVLVRTSEPPCFSVSAMPIRAPAFSPTGAAAVS